MNVTKQVAKLAIQNEVNVTRDELGRYELWKDGEEFGDDTHFIAHKTDGAIRILKLFAKCSKGHKANLA